ncbi:MAG TPA: AI-2E family transporter [Segeticoccus sp.]|uniref:AI-2E family transporter n=1 Tax=Segeticoccus sp. TaxID=2706531 RepID=UPI002D7E9FA3|nr:AI-2E family transporter [Segeticoccus sp.]HET8600164.1 AI-2E family transporter [Segeticoccus sp.]
MRVAAAWALRFLLVVAALWVLVWLLNVVSLVTITVVVAVMICALLQPAVARLTGLGLPRPLAATLVFVLGVTAIVAATWFVVIQVTSSWTDLSGQLQNAAGTIQHWLVDGPLHIPAKQVDEYTTDLGSTIRGKRSTIVAGVFQTATSAIGVISGVVLCLFMTLFLLFDDGSIWRWCVSLFPKQAQQRATAAGRVAWVTLTAYMRFSVLLGVVNAVTMVIILMVAGMPLVVPLGVLIFLGSMIPMVGILVAGAVIVLVALVTHGATMAIVMAIALFLTVQIEGNLLTPWLLGRAVSLHPLAVLTSVTGGALVGGIFGAFVAVPLVAVISNVVRAVNAQRAVAVTGPPRA